MPTRKAPKLAGKPVRKDYQMNKHLIAGLLLAFSTPFVASAACPAGKTGSNVLDNQSRVFASLTTVGIINFLPGGTLNGTATRSGGAIRLASFSGRWMFDPNCENGMISFLNGQFDNTLNFVNVNAAGVIGESIIPGIYDTLRPLPQGVPAVGNRGFNITFFGTPVTACPPLVGNNPLNALANTGWNYIAGGEGSGAFIATLPNPYAGVLTIGRGLLAPNQIPAAPNDGTTRLNYMRNPQQLLLRDDYVTQGRYTVEPNCTGGSLLFVLNGQYRQYEFFFTDDKMNRMVFVSGDSNTSSTGSATLGLVF
jgi:hypothetical protein